VPPLQADHPGGEVSCEAPQMSRGLTSLLLCDKMGIESWKVSQTELPR